MKHLLLGLFLISSTFAFSQDLSEFERGYTTGLASCSDSASKQELKVISSYCKCERTRDHYAVDNLILVMKYNNGASELIILGRFGNGQNPDGDGPSNCLRLASGKHVQCKQPSH
jgi:hypothetical protein